MAFVSFMNGHEDIYSLSGFFIGAKNSVKRRAYQKRMIFSTVCPKLFGTPKMYQNGPQMTN